MNTVILKDLDDVFVLTSVTLKATDENVCGFYDPTSYMTLSINHHEWQLSTLFPCIQTITMFEV